MLGLRLRLSGLVLRFSTLTLLFGSGTASAGVLYQTGFEAPTYTAGNLAGQDGWRFSGPGSAVVESTTVLSGSQAASVSLAGPTGTSPAFSIATQNVAYDSTANPAALLRVQVSFLLQGTLNAGSQYDALALYGGSPSTFLAQLGGQQGQLGLGGAAGVGTSSVAITTGVWYSLEVDLDFQDGTASAYVDGSYLGSIAMARPVTSLTAVEIGGIGNGGDVVTYFDNLSVSVDLPATVTPEPSSLALVAFGCTSLAGWRRFRSTRA